MDEESLDRKSFLFQIRLLICTVYLINLHLYFLSMFMYLCKFGWRFASLVIFGLKQMEKIPIDDIKKELKIGRASCRERV